MYEIKKIKLWPGSLILGISGMIFTLIAVMIIFSLLLITGEISFENFHEDPAGFLVLGGIVLGSGISFFLTGLVGFLIYNFIADHFKGIQLEISYQEKPVNRLEKND